LLQNITKAATQLYAPSGSVDAFVVLLLDQVEEAHTENPKDLKGTGWKQNTRHKKLRLF
jgi:hypothetical protein